MSIAQFTIDLMKTSIFWVSKKGIIENVNKAACKTLGYRRLELLGLALSKIDPRLNATIWETYWETLKKEKSTDLETEHFSKLGQSIPVKMHAYYISLGEEEYVVLRASSIAKTSRYQQLFEVTERVAKIGAWDWNLETDEALNTKEVLNIHEVGPGEELNPERGFSCFDQEEAERLRTAIEHTKKHKVPFEITLRFTSFRGTKKIVYIAGTPKVFNNKVIKLQGVMQDVTSLKRLERHSYLKDNTIESIGELVFWARTDGSFVFVNNSAVEHLLYSKEELMQLHVWDIVVDLPKEQWINRVENVKKLKRSRFSTFHRRKDGSTYPTNTELTYIPYQGKEYICSVVRNEEATYAYQEQLKLIEFTIEHAGEMIFWLDETGSYEYVNEQVCGTYGYSKEELLQMTVYDITKDFKEEDWVPLWQHLQKEKKIVLNTTHYKKDGTAIEVEITANLVVYRDKTLCCSFVRDITNKKKFDRQTQLTTQTINQAEDIIIWTNLEGELIYSNRAVQEQLGYSEAEFRQLKKESLIVDYQQQERVNYRKSLKKQKNFIGECTLKRKDGTEIITELKSSLVTYEGEQINCSIFRDITERKKKELKLEQLLEENLALKEGLQAENTYLTQELSLNHNFDDIISTSPKYATILSNIEEVADTGATVMITGETGTGKELLARAVHHLSERSEQPLVKINCAALPENLIESELFGHEKGSFTGAINRKIGRFELANKATLFLDEIGELPIDLQPKLLRVLQEGEFSRLGSNTTLKTDVRIIAATNRDLPKMVAAGTFREDLYYRLNVYPIHNIPLRERKEDIPLLVKYFLKKFNDRIGRQVSKVSARSLTKLHSYDYPGNIRELENIIERAVITSKAETLDLSQWKPDKEKNPTANQPFLTFEAMERKHILDALKKTNWKVSGDDGAAALLGLNGKTLDSKMRRLAIKRKDFMIQ